MFEHNSDNGSAEGSTEPQTEESRLAPLSPATTRDLVQLFKLLGDDTRVRVLHYLTQREELNVRTLCKLLSQSQPAVSHHLALLREDGIIACRRDGKHTSYPIVPKRMLSYLDLLFGACYGETKKVRMEVALLTYGR
ncbi:MAG: metalloregulator ArsR/SmtB family transcription factor, partial [Pirellulaceae bacterium]|nr:metalloregulator ArsR/SmtB family transcription factor [Pirellulaceae bacterium]